MLPRRLGGPSPAPLDLPSWIPPRPCQFSRRLRYRFERVDLPTRIARQRRAGAACRPGLDLCAASATCTQSFCGRRRRGTDALHREAGRRDRRGMHDEHRLRPQRRLQRAARLRLLDLRVSDEPSPPRRTRTARPASAPYREQEELGARPRSLVDVLSSHPRWPIQDESKARGRAFACAAGRGGRGTRGRGRRARARPRPRAWSARARSRRRGYRRR